MIVTERFELSPLVKRALHNKQPRFGFGGLGALVYYRSYSRLKPDGSQEHWPDTIIRCVEGVFSILKDWYVKNRLPWDEEYWQGYAVGFAHFAYDMKWLPPGRGMYAGGTPYVYERGAAAHQNCGATSVTRLSRDVSWVMDMLLNGVGIGFDTNQYSDRLRLPAEANETFIIPDSREGWAESVQKLIESYERGGPRVDFDYSLIRPAGEPIRGFGGTASGSDPLRDAHEKLRLVLDAYARDELPPARLITDAMNIVGGAVVAGGVRRTAEIALGSPHDNDFLDLKNYKKNPERQAWGWASNNSCLISDHADFTRLPEIAERIRVNGEPGLLSLINVQRFGRMNEEMRDEANLVNPCGEQPLEDKEVCCLSDVFLPRCNDVEEFYKAIEYATFYASTVTLLPTHSPETNLVVAKNRRIGVSISGMAEWLAQEPVSTVIGKLRKGYQVARETNARLARMAGVPPSVRVTTTKPNGSTSQLVGVSPGIHLPLYGRYVRRVRAQENSPIVIPLLAAGLPYEPDAYSANTLVFEYPIDLGKVKGQRDVTMWQKGWMALMMQRHWSDNCVSVTVTFDPKTEGDQVEDFLAYTMPHAKSISMLPDGEEGAFVQMPYEPITLKEYEDRKSKIRDIDWSKFGGSDGNDEKFCTSEGCVV